MRAFIRFTSYSLFAIHLALFTSSQLSAQSPLRILPLGNSITYDENLETRPVGDKKGYRWQLYNNLLGSGYTFDFVGSESSGSNFLPAGFTENGGFPGITPTHLVQILTNGYNPFTDLYRTSPQGTPYLQAYPCDAILLHIGTNALNDNTVAATYRDRVLDILDMIDDYEALVDRDISVFLAQIVNRLDNNHVGNHAPTTYYNGLLETLYNSRKLSGDLIFLVNMGTGASIDYADSANGGDFVDTWHPGPTGYTKMGNKWHEVLETYNFAPPTVSNIPNQSFTETEGNKTLDLKNYVTDPQDAASEMTWSVASTPVYFNVSISVTDIVTITPKNPEVAASEIITFIATDPVHGSVSFTDSDASTINYTTVNDKPIVTGPANINIDEDDSLEIDLGSIDFTDPDNSYPNDFSLILTPGNHLNFANGKLLPEPNWFGNTTLGVVVNDGSVNSVLFNIQVNVQSVNDLPVISSTPLLTANEGLSYSYTITATDIESDVLSAELKSVLPSWLNFNATTKNFSGTPGAADGGTVDILVEIKDEDNGITTQSFTLTVVLSDSHPPQFIALPNNMAIEKEMYSSAITFTDIDGDEIEVTFENLPQWLTYNSDNYQLTGVPENDDTGNNTFTIIISDNIYSKDTTAVIFVESVNDIPVIEGTSIELTTKPETEIVIGIETLLVNDPDNIFPDEFELTLHDGENYSRSSQGIIPNHGFKGILSVNVSVNDGLVESEITSIPIKVTDLVSTTLVRKYPFSVFPNPAQDQLTLLVENNAGIQFQLFDITGHLLLVQEIEEGKTHVSINLLDFPSGVYLYQVKSFEFTVIDKLIIRK